MQVVFMTSVFPLLTAIAALWVSETRVPLTCQALQPDVLLARCRYLLRVGLQVLPALVFVFCYAVPPSTLDIYPSYIYQSLNLEPWFLQLNAFMALLGGMCGTLIYFMFFVNLDLTKVFVISTILASLSGASQMLVPLVAGQLGMVWFLPIDSAVVALFARISVTPPMVLAAQSCPPGMEATLFTLFSTVSNLSNTVSSALSLLLVDDLNVSADNNWSSLWVMILVCGVTNLLPLLLLPCLRISPSLSASTTTTLTTETTMNNAVADSEVE